MHARTKWMTPATALAIHERQLAEHGGRIGVRDEALRASALARPEQVHSYRETFDLADLASSLAFGLVRNMPFIDGNKRTAHVCYRVFLDLNHALLAPSDEAMFVQMLELAEGMHDADALSTWLRTRIRDCYQIGEAPS